MNIFYEGSEPLLLTASFVPCGLNFQSLVMYQSLQLWKMTEGCFLGDGPYR